MKFLKMAMYGLCLGLASTLSAQMTNGLEVMKTYQDALQVNDLKSGIEYHNISRKGKVQERKLQQFIQKRPEGKNRYNLLLQFTAPLDVKGTGTLTWQHEDADDDQWLYLPALRTSKRISPGRKTDRFMGTEITYEDLSNYLSESLEKYDYQLTGEERRKDADCYVIEATPTDAQEKKNSGYSKRVLWIAKDTYVNVHTEFYDKKGALLKEYSAWDIESVGGHYRPLRAKMDNVQTGNKTEVIYAGIQIDTGLESDLFTKTYLENQ